MESADDSMPLPCITTVRVGCSDMLLDTVFLTYSHPSDKSVSSNPLWQLVTVKAGYPALSRYAYPGWERGSKCENIFLCKNRNLPFRAYFWGGGRMDGYLLHLPEPGDGAAPVLGVAPHGEPQSHGEDDEAEGGA